MSALVERRVVDAGIDYSSEGKYTGKCLGKVRLDDWYTISIQAPV